MHGNIAKPKEGEPCNNCGLCCRMALCPVAEIAKAVGPPCEYLISESGGYLCKLVLAERVGLDAGVIDEALIAKALGVGEGCTMEDDA